MNERPTPETDAAIHVCSDTSSEWHGDWVSADDARRVERERDDLLDRLTALEQCMPIELAKFEREREQARDAAEKAKAFKRVMKDNNAKLRRDLDKAQRDADTFLENFGKTQERAINAERELDEARDDHRFLLREIFNITQIGDPHPADLPMKALKAIAETIDEYLKEARK